jgi:uncharacterized membrane protein YhaH (DUF805 family)
VSFPDAVRSVVVENYFNFQGRARRSQYWWYYLAYTVAYLVLWLIDLSLFGSGKAVLSGLFALALLLPTLGVGVRRLHDTDRSGWWILLGALWWLLLIPLIILIVWLAQDSQPGTNKYGPSPKETASV